VTDLSLNAVFFDIDDTLFSSTRFQDRARTAAISAMIEAGVRAPEEKIRSLLREIIDEHDSNFGFQFDEVLRRLPIDSYAPVNTAVIVASAIVAYHDLKFRELKPYDDVSPLLDKIAGAGLRLGVVTHGIPTKQAEKLIRLGMLERFEPGLIFIDQQMGAGGKEEPGFWREVAKRSGVEASRCMYVGDHPVKDIDGASGAGFLTVLVKRGGKYAGVAGNMAPTHEVADLAELNAILTTTYGV
jgi:putative hydrolase of the HAD superfamily